MFQKINAILNDKFSQKNTAKDISGTVTENFYKFTEKFKVH